MALLLVAAAHAGAAITAIIGLMMPPPPPPPPPGGWSGRSSHPTGQDLVAIKKAKAEAEVNALIAKMAAKRRPIDQQEQPKRQPKPGFFGCRSSTTAATEDSATNW